MNAKLTIMQLCCEIRAMIWDAAMPEDVAETCLLLHQPSPTDLRVLYVCKPLTVDIAFPILMHICHESRQHAVKKSRFRYSAAARTMVPFRHFRPDIDTLYVHGLQSLSALRHLEEPIFKDVRRLALSCWRPLCATTPSRPSSAACIFSIFPRVETISVVMPSSEEMPSRHKLHPSPPAGRFRLEPCMITSNTNIISSYQPLDYNTTLLLNFLRKIRCDIACYHGRMWQSLGPRYGQEGSHIAVILTAHYFTAWSNDISATSRGGLFHDSVRFPDGFRQLETDHVKVRGRLNPEKVRINDLC